MLYFSSNSSKILRPPSLERCRSLFAFSEISNKIDSSKYFSSICWQWAISSMRGPTEAMQLLFAFKTYKKLTFFLHRINRRPYLSTFYRLWCSNSQNSFNGLLFQHAQRRLYRFQCYVKTTITSRNSVPESVSVWCFRKMILLTNLHHTFCPFISRHVKTSQQWKINLNLPL